MNLFEKTPWVSNNAFVAPNAAVIGDVEVGDQTSVWYGAVVRGDANAVTIGSVTNIQDKTVIQTQPGTDANGFPAGASIGDYCSVGHGSMLVACEVEDEVVIGSGCVVSEGALVEKHSMLAAGTVVPPGRRIPSGQLWGGNPAAYVRDLTEDEVAGIKVGAREQATLGADHALEFLPYGTVYQEAEKLEAAN